MNALDRITDALDRHGSNRRGNDWTCPSHPDKDPSLSVTEGDNGVVMHCHAGCEVKTILETLGLGMADLFDTPVPIRRKILASYPYTDEKGNLLYEVLRYDPKDFRQRTPDGNGGYRWKLNGIRRVLYRLPEVLTAIEEGKTIYIVEGEKDANAFYDHGLVATCNSGGAGKWRPECTDSMHNAHVVVVADRDETGRKHAEQVTSSLRGVAASVRTVEPKSGKDASDHFTAGYDATDFIDISTEELEPKNERRSELWAHVRTLEEVKALPPPTYLIDQLIVSDSLFIIYGMPRSMKTFLALDFALSMAYGKADWFGHQVMTGPVLYIVTEGLAGIGKRVTAWEEERRVTGEADITIIDRAVNLLDPLSVGGLYEVVEDLQPMMTIFDTLARSMPGADENSFAAMSQAIGVMDEVRERTRGAVGALHHTPKDGSTPRGHSSLYGAVQTSIKLENNEGEISLTVDKQKDDEEISMKLRARKVLDSLVLWPQVTTENSAGVESELMLAKVMAETCIPGVGMSSKDLNRLSGLRERTFERALKGLERRGRIKNIGSLRQTRWVLID